VRNQAGARLGLDPVGSHAESLGNLLGGQESVHSRSQVCAFNTIKVWRSPPDSPVENTDAAAVCGLTYRPVKGASQGLSAIRCRNIGHTRW
jgi:hypothetical protein